VSQQARPSLAGDGGGTVRGCFATPLRPEPDGKTVTMRRRRRGCGRIGIQAQAKSAHLATARYSA